MAEAAKDKAKEKKTMESKFLMGLQHFLSMFGSIILLPVVYVPLMGGTDKDLQRVISTTMMVSGIATIACSLVGSRLPLIQGTNLCYLFPILLLQSQDRYNTPGFLARSAEARFKTKMQELQGALIITSAFTIVLGLSGVMSFIVKLITPVVVAATVTSVGLAFYKIGFVKVADCVEIGVPVIVVIFLVALYAQPRLIQAYAVPIGLIFTWLLALILTEAGAWDYNGCSLRRGTNPDRCELPLRTMRACRTDAKTTVEDTPWIRAPYPFQWGRPIFHIESICIMLAGTVIGIVDSVGLYHSTSMLIISKPPPTSALSRGIVVEGLSTFFAAAMGTGAGSSSLSDNIHTLSLTRFGSRKALQACSVLLIILSIIGKVPALVAQIPYPIAYGVLCFLFALNVAIGISNMRFTEMASGRNLVVLGAALFFGLSVQSYFADYVYANRPITRGPIRSDNRAANYILNGYFQLEMIVAFVVVLFLEATVPGTAKERGLYVWAKPGSPRGEPALLAPVNIWFKYTNY